MAAIRAPNDAFVNDAHEAAGVRLAASYLLPMNPLLDPATFGGSLRLQGVEPYGELAFNANGEPTGPRADFMQRFRATHQFDPVSTRWTPDEEYYDRLGPTIFEARGDGVRNVILFAIVAAVLLCILYALLMRGCWNG